MADIPLSQLVGGDVFIADDYETINIAFSTSGNVTIACPAGKKIVLTGMSSTSSQNNVSVIFGGRTIIDDLTLLSKSSGGATLNAFSVGFGNSNPSIMQLMGNIDEDLIFNFGSSTSAGINISYLVGK